MKVLPGRYKWKNISYCDYNVSLHLNQLILYSTLTISVKSFPLVSIGKSRTQNPETNTTTSNRITATV